MFCPKCGNNIPDGVKFCPKCGNAIGGAESKFTAPRPEKREAPPKNDSYQPSSPLKSGYLTWKDGVCPDCGSHHCEIQVLGNVTTSGSNYSCCSGGLGAICMGPFGLLCGLCGTGKKTTTTHKSVWVCKDCGNQFATRKDRFTDFVAQEALINYFVWLFFAYSIISVCFLKPSMVVSTALLLLFWYLDVKVCKNALGASVWMEENLANGTTTQAAFENARRYKALLAIIPRTPEKKDIARGILTKEQITIYRITVIAAILAGFLLGITLGALSPI